MRLAVGLMALLAACGTGSETPGTSDPAGQNLAAVADGRPAVQTAAAKCTQKPDFVPVYPHARISLCAAAGEAGGQQSGTIVYTSAAEPKTVLGWSREQANASGLGQRMFNETMYSAGETAKRSIMVLVEPEGSGSRVTVNWGSL